MGIFKSSEPNTAAINGRAAASEAAISLIGPGMKVTGEVATEGTVRIEGSIDGTVRAGKAVFLAKGGEILGDIITQDAILAGHVAGRVIAESRLELQSTASIEGDIHARAQHLKLEEGARFSGRVHMLEEREEPMRALPAGAVETPDAE